MQAFGQSVDFQQSGTASLETNIAYDKNRMRKFFAYVLATLPGLLVFGVGIFRGLNNSSPAKAVGIVIYVAATSILIALGSVGLAWSVNWIRKQKTPPKAP